MLSNWELARYLIDAKKCVDSLLYASQNNNLLGHIDLRAYIRSKVRDFYLDSCYILDNVLRKSKKERCASNDTLRCIYVERDQNSAHKDFDYEDKNPIKLTERIKHMQLQLACVVTVCKEALPTNLTLDYVPHDRVLYRLSYGITSIRNTELGDAHRLMGDSSLSHISESVLLNVFEDTEQLSVLRKNSVESKDVVLYKRDGLTVYEALQEFQDSLLKVNVVHGCSLWMSWEQKSKDLLDKLVTEAKLTQTLSWSELELKSREIPELQLVKVTGAIFREVVENV